MFRYPWVTAKLLLILSVMLVCGFVIGPAETVILEKTRAAIPRLIAAATYDVLALAIATGFSVFRPGGAFRRRTSFLRPLLRPYAISFAGTPYESERLYLRC